MNSTTTVTTNNTRNGTTTPTEDVLFQTHHYSQTSCDQKVSMVIPVWDDKDDLFLMDGDAG